MTDPKLLSDLYDTFIFDLDGTVWHDEPIPDAVESIYKLIVKHNKKVLFYTNGGQITRKETWERVFSTFRDYLDEARFSEIASSLTQDCVYNTSYLTAAYLKATLKDDLDAKINIIGMKALQDEIREAGLKNAQL